MKKGNHVLVALAFCLACLLFVLFAAATADLSDAWAAELIASASPADDSPATQAPSASSSATEQYASPDIAPANPVWVQTSASDVSTCTTPALSAPIFWDTPPKAGSVVSVGDQQFIQPGPDDQVRIIIHLQGESMASYKSRLRADPKHLSEAERAQVESYAGKLRRDHKAVISRIEAQGVALEVRQEYSYILNGFAASTKMADMKRIKDIPGVLGVYPDYEVRALLTESVPLIGADQVWAMRDANGQPVTGRGIRVAILDTGIDYTHPDLGGCFGAGCKVAAGYDFVNKDADPMDDNGHGTHCAGIVAANGTVKGVAPDAILYAYKVLNSNGSGSSSDIIAAIERATDPDDDPATNDAVDIISMSLGGSGNPDEPLAQAVDAAVDQGVVVAVASGNRGSGYGTIDSPGVARKALTVGATDKNDLIANFSSRGPISDFYDLVKPNIVAPGVAINSTYLGGGYAGMSGTSMATPHIAGAAALVKQLHPAWPPATIQANLMNTAKNLGLDVFTQGAGRVQVDRAVRAGAVLAPGSVGFGLVDAEQPVWTKTEILRLTNVTTASVSYTLQVSGTLPAGVTTRLEPAGVTLGAGDSVTVTFQITVDNALTPYQSQAPGSYEGQVVASPFAGTRVGVSSAPEPLAVPFTFIKSPQLQIAFDEEPGTVVVHDGTGVPTVRSPSGTMLSLLLPAGTYDVWTIYKDYATWVVKEGLVVTGVTHLNVARSDAVHKITLAPVDKNGEPILAQSRVSAQQLSHMPSGWSIAIGQPPCPAPSMERYFSDVSTNYSYAWRLDTSWAGDWYEFNDRFVGVSGDSLYQNTTSALRHVAYQFHPGPDQLNLTVTPQVTSKPFG